MRLSLTSIIVLTVFCCQGQNQTMARYFSEYDSACAAPRARIWGPSLWGPLLLVDPSTRAVYANQPIPTDTLPDSVGLANTSVTWNGVQWAMVLLPLPAEPAARRSLLLHESFHRLQESLGLPTSSPTIPYLDTKEGRIWFRLELQALSMAVSKPIGARAYDLQSALLFRTHRYALHPGEDSLEHALEWNEGLAEFTGVYASGIAEQDTDYLASVVRADTARPSFTRSFAYFTGPLYGTILSQRNKDWPKGIGPTDNFTELVRRIYGLPSLDADLETRALAYQAVTIRAQENARESRHLASAEKYRAALVKGPVMILFTGQDMHVSFNPNNLFDLGADGTVYPDMTMTDAWGTLTVTGGALFKDWKKVSVPAGNTTSALSGPATLRGPGWTLTLHTGWKLAPGPRQGDWILER